MKKRYLIGFGNYTMSDDAVGLRVAEKISSEYQDNKNFEIEIINGDSLKILNYFTEETEKIVIIDAALMNKEPGEIVIFTPEKVISQKVNTNITSHESDILKLLEFAETAELPIPQIKIIAIEPKKIDWGMDLTDEIRSKVDTIKEKALYEIMN